MIVEEAPTTNVDGNDVGIRRQGAPSVTCNYKMSADVCGHILASGEEAAAERRGCGFYDGARGLFASSRISCIQLIDERSCRVPLRSVRQCRSPAAIPDFCLPTGIVSLSLSETPASQFLGRDSVIDKR